MSEISTTLGQLQSNELLISLARAALFLVVGWLFAHLSAKGVGRILHSHTDSHYLQLWRRGAFYTVFTLFALSALRELGFELSVLLGAAGILTVAVGFASQTAASNLISGLFLLFEKPYKVGDIIKVGATAGEVLSIDALSVKLRTFDNLYVRIPNETLIKSETTTITRFPIRRIDIMVGVAYKEDLSHIRGVLTEVAHHNPLCLEEPKPLFIFQGFGDSSLDIQFSVWAKRESFLDLKNSIHEEIKNAFDAAGIEIPFPHRTLYTGSITEPFPVRMVGEVAPSPGQGDGA
jgi:small-conductance mechanosensitive channel